MSAGRRERVEHHFGRGNRDQPGADPGSGPRGKPRELPSIQMPRKEADMARSDIEEVTVVFYRIPSGCKAKFVVANDGSGTAPRRKALSWNSLRLNAAPCLA